MNVTIFSDIDKLSRSAADYIVRVAHESVADHGVFTIALSGGSTPKKLYGILANEPYRSQLDWNKIEIFWCDERCVPPDDAESNYHLADEFLFSKLSIPASHIHRAPADAEDRDAASLAYTQEMRRVFHTDGIPRFDLIQLGMGPEAHTASLFPHQASLHERERLVMPVSVPKPPPARLTFTLPLLNAAQHILFLLTGSEKDAALAEVLEGAENGEEYPAQNIRPSQGKVTWMIDTGAAKLLKKTYKQQQ
ncbi:6-phosphogluconolactonase [Ktedonobacteria bacterium brp13]|nr:6-phosphogluconolactonase [Ktedonobacteria bacterium brp13]